MLSFLQFLARRLIAVPITFLVVTLILYGVALLAPIEIRAKLYWPPGASEEWLALNGGAEAVRDLNEQVIKRVHRHGQDKQVRSVELVAIDTYDSGVLSSHIQAALEMNKTLKEKNIASTDRGRVQEGASN